MMIQIAFGALLTMNDDTLPRFLTEIFPTHVRYGGFAFCCNSANEPFGGRALRHLGSARSISSKPVLESTTSGSIAAARFRISAL
ncbi:hypothetical protein [Paraburkholderia sp. BL6665CI2N2]|uniref:hypothetical protein n=1 Tax=Paraburkholderia sp. BL6665CI2N2 TaxID=1938806 RepID=UPI001FBA20F9|nr:hypothetical protein [Paraburkholderia sp. BL6665CI2N2]